LRIRNFTRSQQWSAHFVLALVASLFTVCHYRGWIPEILLRLNHHQSVAEPFVLRVSRPTRRPCFSSRISVVSVGPGSAYRVLTSSDTSNELLNFPLYVSCVIGRKRDH
jgi:hypothetical protein